MKKLRYNELDEMAWEYEHGCYDGPCGDECWDEIDWTEVDRNLRKTGYADKFAEDDEPCDFENGIMGSDIKKSHERDEFKPLNEPTYESDVFHVASSGNIAGVGTGEDIVLAIKAMLMFYRDYHFEFKFFEAK